MISSHIVQYVGDLAVVILFELTDFIWSVHIVCYCCIFGWRLLHAQNNSKDDEARVNNYHDQYQDWERERAMPPYSLPAFQIVILRWIHVVDNNIGGGATAKWSKNKFPPIPVKNLWHIGIDLIGRFQKFKK